MTTKACSCHAGAGLTERVLDAYGKIEDPRLNLIISSLIEHLHGCVREIGLTDEEWEFAWDFMARMAAATTPKRNEFLLLADIIGVSQLIAESNHGGADQPVGYALMGPFYRDRAPLRGRGAFIATEDTSGARVRVAGRVYDQDHDTPIAGAMLDVWQAATNGLYENEDEKQPDFNLRGRFRTDGEGTFEFVALHPTAYAVLLGGPVSELLLAAKRPAFRPAHIHFIISAPGYETLITQVFVKGDPQIGEDIVFTAGPNMMGDFVREEDHFRLTYDFPLRHGVSKLPKAPIPF